MSQFMKDDTKSIVPDWISPQTILKMEVDGGDGVAIYSPDGTRVFFTNHEPTIVEVIKKTGRES